jgi:hypothetical protein
MLIMAYLIVIIASKMLVIEITIIRYVVSDQLLCIFNIDHIIYHLARLSDPIKLMV